MSGFFRDQNRLERLHDLRSLVRVGSRTHSEPNVGLLQVEVAKKGSGHLVVVVLTGMNEYIPKEFSRAALTLVGDNAFLVVPIDRSNDGGRLHEVRSSSNDRYDFHLLPVDWLGGGCSWRFNQRGNPVDDFLQSAALEAGFGRASTLLDYYLPAYVFDTLKQHESTVACQVSVDRADGPRKMLYTGTPRAAASRFIVPPPLMTRSEYQIRFRPFSTFSGIRAFPLRNNSNHEERIKRDCLAFLGTRMI